MPEIKMQQEEAVRDAILKERNNLLTAFIAEYRCLPSELKIVEQWDEDMKRLHYWVEKQ